MTMKTMIGGMIAAVALAFSMVANADVLFWQVDPSATVNYANGSTSSMWDFLMAEPYAPNGNEQGMHYIIGARVSVVSDPSTFSQTRTDPPANGVLRWMETENGRIIQNAANSPVDIGHPSTSLHGSGVSTDDNGIAADRALYYQLAIVLGTHNQWNDDNHYIFQEIAWSGLYRGDYLEGLGSYRLGDMDEAEAEKVLNAWRPDQFYTYRPVPVYTPGQVPEPTPGLLALIGLGFLGLTRIRKV